MTFTSKIGWIRLQRRPFQAGFRVGSVLDPSKSYTAHVGRWELMINPRGLAVAQRPLPADCTVGACPKPGYFSPRWWGTLCDAHIAQLERRTARGR